MRWLDWFLSLFRPRLVTRKIASLSAARTSTDAAVREETIDTSGGPLKPYHHRRALRDPRLLPKPQQPPVWPPFKRPKCFVRQEADRLFSETLRTNNRALRDLTTDEEQLQRYGLPVWKTEQELAAALGITVGQLRHFSIHRQRETSPHYVTFALKKRSGGTRLIHAPKRKLKGLQRRLNELLIGRLPVSQAAHGFRVGRSVATNAGPHVGKPVVVKLDLQNCFPSIGFGRVRGLLIALGYGYPLATALAVLVTEAPRQPVEIDGKLYHVPVGPRACVQGAPTSPGICNAVLCRLDRRLSGLARKRGFAYTRYADDLTFSGDDASGVKVLVALVSRIVKEEGFQLNRKKTRILRKGRCQRVTGVIVNDKLGLSRKERRRMRAGLHRLANADSISPSEVKRLQGKIAYLQMINAAQAAPLKKALERITAAQG